MKNNKLVIIAPCFNEEEVIEYSIEQLLLVLNIMIDDGLISYNSQICFVNDGSVDKTCEIIAKYLNNNKIALIDLSNKFWTTIGNYSRVKLH